MKFALRSPRCPSPDRRRHRRHRSRARRRGRDLDQKTGGTLSRAMKASRFTGKKEETLAILAPAGVEFDRILLRHRQG
uniref:M17 family peptidase N-terminal domain-containing protein n=1 Tax=Azospirillum argentinense TaxID=2970906 RepID=UPI0026B9F45C